MGQPNESHVSLPFLMELTQGSETSQYLVEKKTKVIS